MFEDLMYECLRSKSPFSIFQLVLSFLTSSILPLQYSCIYPCLLHLPIVPAWLHIKSIAVRYQWTFSHNHICPFETEHHHSVQLSHIQVIAYLLPCMIIFQLQMPCYVGLVSLQRLKLTSFDWWTGSCQALVLWNTNVHSPLLVMEMLLKLYLGGCFA